jgi:hypothetical protein
MEAKHIIARYNPFFFKIGPLGQFLVLSSFYIYQIGPNLKYLKKKYACTKIFNPKFKLIYNCLYFKKQKNKKKIP